MQPFNDLASKIKLDPFKRSVLLFMVAFAVVWLVLVTAFGNYLDSQPPFVQFVLVGIPTFLIPSFLVGREYRDVLGQTLGLFFFLLGASLFSLPLSVKLDGTIVTSTLIAGGATDVFLGKLYHGLGLSGFALFVAVYPVSFIACMTAATLLLTDKKLHDLTEPAKK